MQRVRFSYHSKVLCLFLLITTIIFLRSRYAFLYPVLVCEDGTEMLAYFFNNREPSSILHVYAGYVSLLPNLVGYFAVHAPITATPFLLTYYPLLIAGVSHTLFALRRFRVILPDDHGRMLICILLALLPIGDILLFSNTTYSIWNLLWILLLLAYAPLSSAVSRNLLQLAVMALLITSHALSFLIAPICIFNLLTRPTQRDRWLNSSLLLIIALYLATAIVTTNEQFSNPLAALLESFWLVVNRVVVEALIGYQWRMGLHLSGYRPLLDGIGLAILLWLGWLYLRAAKQLSPNRHIQIMIVGYVVVALTTITVLARSTSSYSLWGPWELRYFFIQQKLFWLLLAVSGSIYLASLRQKAKRLIYPVAIGCYVVLLFSYNQGQFQTSLAEGQRLAGFLHTVEQAMKTEGTLTKPVEFVLSRSCFDIRLWVQ